MTRSDSHDDKAQLNDLAATARRACGRGPAPVHLWDPPHCGDIGLRIAADGTWYYQGSPIGRRALVELFASILRKDADGCTYLVTPAEKILIEVADAPFLAVEMFQDGAGRGQTLTFRTDVGDEVAADAEHPLRFAGDPANEGLKPYVLVRGRLEARVIRALYYDLVELAVEEPVAGTPHLGVWSAGQFFPLARSDVIGTA